MIKFSAKDDYPNGGDNNVWTWNERYGHGDLRISTVMLRLGHPYVYNPFKFVSHTATGGFEASHTDLIRMVFFGSPLQGQYWVRRYDVRVNVTYPETWEGVPFVWGLGQGTNSWSGANPNYQVGYCSVVPNSQTATGCQLQTFVYDVYDQFGRHIDWYPCHVNQVSVNYRLWGKVPPGTPQMPGGPKVDANTAPTEFCIASVYPNPFNAATLIEFALPEEGNVNLEIYDLLGQRVLTLFDNRASAGSHRVIWQGKDNAGRDVPSGVYFLKLVSDGVQRTQKITLLR